MSAPRRRIAITHQMAEVEEDWKRHQPGFVSVAAPETPPAPERPQTAQAAVPEGGRTATPRTEPGPARRPPAPPPMRAEDFDELDMADLRAIAQYIRNRPKGAAR